MSVKVKDVDEWGPQKKADYIAKYGQARWDEIASAMSSIPEGKYNSSILKQALDGLKRTK